MNDRRSIITIAALLAALSTGVGCGGSKANFDTPEASFQTLRMAAHNKDIATVCNCLTPESQDVIAGGLVAMAIGAKYKSAANPGDAELKKNVDAFNPVLAKHGLTEEAMAAILPQMMMLAANPAAADASALGGFAKPVKDRVAFTSDMYVAMQQVGEVSFGEEFYEQLAGELKDVKTEGEVATASVVTKSGKAPLEFRKTPEGWKLHLKTENLSPAAG